MKIGIIAAMPEEARALLRRLGAVGKIVCGDLKAYRCNHSGHDITLCEAGMGFGNADKAAETIIREIGPDMLISTGFCGGITPDLLVGDVVVAKSVVIVTGALIEAVSVEIPALCSNFVVRQAAGGARVFGGRFASTPTLMTKTRLAALLPNDSCSQVVEMESAAIAIVAVENGIPFVGIRAVSDPFDEEIGFSLDEFCDDRMRISIPRVLFTVMRKPRIIPQLARLAGNSRIAGVNLAVAIEQFLASA